MEQAPDELLRLREEDLAWREIDAEVVILDLRSSRYLSANQTGRLIWTLLAEGGATRDDLYRAVNEAFVVDRATAQQDVDAFVDELAGRGLLR